MKETVSPGVHCPNCGSTTSIVKDTRPRDRVIYRRRKCMRCKDTWATYEFPEAEVPSMQRHPRDALKALRAMALRIVAHADESLRDD